MVLGSLWLVAIGVGSRLWSLLRLPGHEADSLGFESPRVTGRVSASEFLCFATLLGFGGIAYLVAALCLLQLFSPATVLVALALLAVWSAKPLEHLLEFWWSRIHIENLQPRKRHRIGNRFFFQIFIPMLVLAVLVPSLLAAIQPPCQSDALRYHLAVPEVYVRHNGWVELPHSSFSNFPFMVEMIYAVAILFKSPEATGLIHFGSLLLVLALVYLLGKRLCGARPGLLATALLATSPFLPILAGWAFIEVALAAYQLAAVHALTISEERWKDSSRNSHLRLAGVLLGLCLGIKYTSVFFAAFLFIWVLYLVLRKREHARNDTRQTVRSLLTFCLVAFLVGMPWYLKNLILFGNPIYPLLGESLGHGNWNALNTALYKFHMSLKGGLYQTGGLDFWSRTKDLLTLPWRITINAVDFGGWPVGTVFLPATLFVIVSKRVSGVLRRILLLGLCLFLFWAYTYRDTRFLLLPLAFLSLGIGICADPILRKRGLWGQSVAWVFAIGMLVNYASFAHSLFSRHFPGEYLTNTIGREGFLAKRLDYYPAFMELEKLSDDNISDSDKVLFIGEHRGMYCPVDYVASDWFDTPVIVRWLRETRDNLELLERLRAEGIGYVLYNEKELSLYFSPWFLLQFLPEAQALQCLETARNQGRNLNSVEERQFLERQATMSPLFERYKQFIENRQWLEPIWEEQGVTLFRVLQ